MRFLLTFFLSCCLLITTACNANYDKQVEITPVLEQEVVSPELVDTSVSTNQIAVINNDEDLDLVKQDGENQEVKRPIICIEAGHQGKANLNLEPNAPNSKTMKEKVRGGTQGVQTKKPEYQLNLEVAIKLENALTEDFDVIMVRRTNNVDISNSERAIVCNEAQADVMIRLHADGNENSRVQGMTFFYPSIDNKYTKPIAKQSATISKVLAEQIINETDAKSRGVKPRGDLTGFNWLKVPSILIEMGFMTNKKEDVLLSDPDYQDKIVLGIKKGLDAYYFHK